MTTLKHKGKTKWPKKVSPKEKETSENQKILQPRRTAGNRAVLKTE
jgi:hypothetical protein